jgi:para-nitrobenzyl esterase
MDTIVETAVGKVRGSFARGVHAFRGIPYGASPEGPLRFMAPAPVPSWTGIRDALDYGPISMQDDRVGLWRQLPIHEGNMTPHGHAQSENCLFLNLWTPGLSSELKCPVMVWCHGGGFVGGMGDAEWHDGERLARDHNVVVVHFNHRLNVFGFLHLAELGGEQYANSGNAGMLDIVAVLRWVRENIERFGGDSQNVTVFGESGGGGKVAGLMAMPAARGLFHKAIVQSGYPVLRFNGIDEANRTAHAVFGELELSLDDVSRLQNVPAQELLRACLSVSSRQMDRLRPQHVFQPVVEGRVFPDHPFDPKAPACSASVPMLIGTVRDECGFLALHHPDLRSLSRASINPYAQSLGVPEGRLTELVNEYYVNRPRQQPGDILLAIASDAMFRMPAIAQAERKSDQGVAPAYMYYFARQAPGDFRAGHGTEVPFVFLTLNKAPGLRRIETGDEEEALARNMSAAWTAFARTGNPNHPGLPTWTPYDRASRSTMQFDAQSSLVDDPMRADRLACAKAGVCQ